MNDRVCHHGGLARKCEICEQEAEWRQSALDGQAALDERDNEIVRLRVENEQLRETFSNAVGVYAHAFPSRPFEQAPQEQRFAMLLTRLTDENERLRVALDELVRSAEPHVADQSGAPSPACGRTQPITVQEGIDLCRAVARARAALEGKP